MFKRLTRYTIKHGPEFLKAAAAITGVAAIIHWFWWQAQVTKDDRDHEIRISKLESMVWDLKTEVHDKEVACKVLEASISSSEYNHKYCKGER